VEGAILSTALRGRFHHRSDFRGGAIQQTGRELDVAVQGDGWIAVQVEGGSEAYTATAA